MGGVTHCALGAFDLELDDSGKLSSLFAAGHDLLSHTDYRFDMGGGREFAPMGWDECFPTIEPHGGSPAMGDLVGRAPETVLSVHSAGQIWRMPRYVAKREFASRGGTGLEVRFSVENTGSEAVEFLWASHALFSVEGLAEVVLPDGTVLDEFSIEGTCRKFFTRSGEPIVMRRAGITLTLDTDQPFWGIWHNRGGWPATGPAPFAALGIEATNTQGEAPQGARIDPGGRFAGRMRIEITGG